MNKNIGMFQGLKVYSMPRVQFLTKNYDTKALEGAIILTEPDKELWYYNQRIGKVGIGGNVLLEKEPYVVELEVAAQKKAKEAKSGVEEEFAQYTKIVDEFFEKLKLKEKEGR